MQKGNSSATNNGSVNIQESNLQPLPVFNSYLFQPLTKTPNTPNTYTISGSHPYLVQSKPGVVHS